MKHKHLLLSLTLGLSGALFIIVAMLLRSPTPSLGHPLDENEAAVAHAVASRPSANVAAPAPDRLPVPEASTPNHSVALIPIPGTQRPHFGADKPVGDFPLAPPLGSDADFVVSLDSDRVWGLVGAGETVTVTVNGAQMGAALANNLGFFWTTLYDANGDRPNLSGGETVTIYSNGVQAATTTLRAIAGHVDPLNDDVNGVIGGAGFPLEVTVYTGQTGEPTLISYSQSANTDGSGNFTVDFTGNWDYFADEYAVIAYTEGGVEVHRYARAQRLVALPFPNMGVTGFSIPGATVTMTIYMADGVTIREQISDITDPETGRYRFSPGMETTDIVVVEVEGGLVMSRTVEAFEFTVDAQSDRMVGLTTPGAMILGRASDLTANGHTAVLVHGVADASGVFTLDFSASADLMPGQWVGAYIADAEGDDLNLWAPVQGFVDVNQTWNEVTGWAVTPPGSLGEGHPLTLTVYHAADDSVSVYTKGSGWHGSYTFNQDDGLPDIEPGDVITVESAGYAWQGVVHVQAMTATVDVENDRFTGAVTAPTERVELWGRLGSSEPYLYPLAGEFTMLITATSPFSGVPAGFDVGYDIEYEVRHRTTGDNLERISGVTDGFGAWLPDHFMWASITPPETPYTLTLYNNAGAIKAQTTGISHPPVGSTDGFDVQATGQAIQPGDSIQAQSATGFSQTVMVPALSVNAVLGDDLVTGHGPANTLLHFGVFRDDNRYAEGFVPTDADGAYAFRVNQLQEVSDDGNLRHGDYVHISYMTPQQAWIIDRYDIPFAEVGVSKWNPGGFARPGGKAIYSISYQNNGNATAADTVIVDTLPLSTTYAGDNSGFTPDIGAEGVITWHVGDLDPGTYRQFAVTLNVDTSVPEGDDALENCLTISTATPGDNDPGNDQACSTVNVWNDEVEIGVNKWPDPGDPTPGQEFTYHIEVCNHRGTMVGPVLLTDTLPNDVSVVYWNHDNPWAVGWQEVTVPAGIFALTTAGFPGNFCDTVHLRLLLDADAPLGANLSNHVSIAVLDDVYEENNTHLNQDANVSAPRYDLHLDKNMHSGVLVPGGWINYFISYNNQGNTTSHVWVTDTIPAGLSFDFAHWGGGQPGENEPLPAPTIVGDQIVWDLGELPVSGSRWFHVQMNIADTLDADDVITNCAVIGSDGAESTPADNESCYSVTLNDPGPNLRVTKESWWNGDGQLGYRVHFYNLGDESIFDVWITDTLPTGTTWDGWWNLNWDWDRLVTQSLNSDVLAWQFSDLNPGEYAQLEFNANLDEPGVPLRWFTNTVEITALPNETTPEDNAYSNVAFSGGEVRRAEMWLGTDHADMWGEGAVGPVTITTAYTQVVVWGDPSCNGCWNTGSIGPIWPGDTVIVEAGDGLLPVTIAVPDPFDVAVDSASNMVWGQIAGAANQPVQIHGYWPSGFREIWMNAESEYSVTYPDVPRGAQGHVRYQTVIDYADVMFHRRFQAADLLINVDYSHNSIDGNYERGHTGWVTVTSNITTEIKATVEVTTEQWPWWGGGSGFSTHHHQWSPEQPDIVPSDWVYATLDNGDGTSVRVGTINAGVDVVNDVVSGTLDVSWFSEGLQVRCEIHDEENAPSIQIENVNPQGGEFYCDFNGMWDITPGQNVAIRYTEPDGNSVLFRPANPAPYLRVEKWLEGSNPAVGGNAVFRVQYRNEGDADAENVVITDTLQGMTFITDTSSFAHTGSGNQVVLDLGTVAPDDWIYFYVFAEVTAAANERITNTVEIATSTPYDQGDEGEKRGEWSGDVQPNDTYLNVGKSAWTGDPAAGYDVVFAVNTCNFGSTASSEVVLTDTLHPSLTLQTWWGQHPGWVEVSFSDHELVVSRPTIAGGCSEVYVRATVDAAAEAGTPISNTATIYAANDLGADNITTWDGYVNDPHTNLNVYKSWNWGQLVPGGELRYNVNVQNNGNVPVDAFRITETLPVSTTFVAAWTYDQTGQHAFDPTFTGDGVLAWDIAGLDNGYRVDFEIVLQVAQDAQPGTVLVNTAEVTHLPGEDTYDDNVSVWTETLFDHGPNLRVSKWGDWHGDRPGHAWYQFRVENVGDAPIAQAVITDTYPALMTLEGGINTDWSRVAGYTDNPAEHWFEFTLNDVWPGYRLDFSFSTTMDEPVAEGLILTNTVMVAPVAGDTNPSDDSADYVLTTGTDLFVEKTLVDGVLLPGELVTFSLIFGNGQPGHAGWWNMEGDARLTDVLPGGWTYISAKLRYCEGSDWCDRPPDIQVGLVQLWLFDPLNTGTWNEIHLTAQVPYTATGLDAFTNRAEIASSQPTQDIEPDYDNNIALAEVKVDLPYFEVSKAYESTAIAGMPVTYTLTVTNSGNSVGTGIILSDTIPAGLENVEGGTLMLPWMWWYIDSLAPNGGVATEMLEATLPCAVSTVVNDDYRVVDSEQGVSSTVGAPVSVDVLAPTLNVEFDQSAVTAPVSATLRFTDTSTTNGPAIAAWAWDFDDGHSASGANATHTYTTDGVFTVRLTITDTCGYTATTTSVVTIAAPTLVASFDQSTVSAVAGTTIYFTDTSTTNVPPIVAWTWDFGDSGVSAAQNPTHQYETAGEFTITLVITDALGYSDVATSTITVTPACVPLTGISFTYQPATVLVNTLITFTTTYSPANATAPITYDWSFGDGQAAVVVTTPITHTYATVGDKTVQLTAYNSCTPGGVPAQQIITVKSSSYSIFLPLVLRNH